MKKIGFYILILAVLCLATHSAEPFFDQHAKSHGPFFYAWYGFASSLFMVLVAKIIGLFTKRNETYYEEK